MRVFVRSRGRRLGNLNCFPLVQLVGSLTGRWSRQRCRAAETTTVETAASWGGLYKKFGLFGPLGSVKSVGASGAPCRVGADIAVGVALSMASTGCSMSAVSGRPREGVSGATSAASIDVERFARDPYLPVAIWNGARP